MKKFLIYAILFTLLIPSVAVAWVKPDGCGDVDSYLMMKEGVTGQTQVIFFKNDTYVCGYNLMYDPQTLIDFTGFEITSSGGVVDNTPLYVAMFGILCGFAFVIGLKL